MKICEAILKGTQVYNSSGTVHLCCMAQTDIGKLTENTLEELWNGEKTRQLFERFAQGDYSLCDRCNCKFLTSGQQPPLIEIDEIPKYPSNLSISFERVCNYQCSVCSIPIDPTYNANDSKMEETRKIIAKNLESVLPHLKHIEANGSGELFASKYALNMLANWSPISPKEELSVRLESNGSLFDEQHWKQIENLGQYNLRVDITVMSFDEHTYQTLSGVRYPISRIEHNLHFIQSLREKGIVNYFQIATVVQERNFRMLPAFVKKCIEEFNPDSIRLRPYAPNGNYPPERKWFTDVRNVLHPHHEEYLQILKDPILKHPKVDDWGIFEDSPKWELPYKVALSNEIETKRIENKILCNFIMDENFLDDLLDFLRLQNKKIIIHEASAIGCFLAKKLLKNNMHVEYITDLKSKGNFFGIPIVHPRELPPPSSGDSIILVAALRLDPYAAQYFYNLGYDNNSFVVMQINFSNDN